MPVSSTTMVSGLAGSLCARDLYPLDGDESPVIFAVVEGHKTMIGAQSVREIVATGSVFVVEVKTMGGIKFGCTGRTPVMLADGTKVPAWALQPGQALMCWEEGALDCVDCVTHTIGPATPEAFYEINLIPPCDGVGITTDGVDHSVIVEN